MIVSRLVSIGTGLKHRGKTWCFGLAVGCAREGPCRFSLAMREPAAEAFARQDNSDVLRHAALAGSRGSRNLELCAGSICHVWRSVGPRKRGRFVGPARLLGRDAHGWWVVYRNGCILADARQLCRSIVEEREAWELVRGAALGAVSLGPGATAVFWWLLTLGFFSQLSATTLATKCLISLK